jgi:uncharacterized protein YeaO (DUF488 family)
MKIRLKRIYEKIAPTEGYRVLVDRLWPRGVSKAEAGIDCWAKELAPSRGLRLWYGHDTRRWQEFRERYRKELADDCGPLSELLRQANTETITLVFAARDVEHSNVSVLKEFMEQCQETKGDACESAS